MLHDQDCFQQRMLPWIAGHWKEGPPPTAEAPLWHMGHAANSRLPQSLQMSSFPLTILLYNLSPRKSQTLIYLASGGCLVIIASVETASISILQGPVVPPTSGFPEIKSQNRQ